MVVSYAVVNSAKFKIVDGKDWDAVDDKNRYYEGKIKKKYENWPTHNFSITHRV